MNENLVQESLEVAALEWVRSRGAGETGWGKTHYSTASNEFLWAAEKAYFQAIEARLEELRAEDPLDAVTKGQHIVYRAWDGKGDLLYIGVTSNWPTRVRAHERHSVWWQWKESFSFSFFETRSEANRAELEAIYLETPPFNRQGVPTA